MMMLMLDLIYRSDHQIGKRITVIIHNDDEGQGT